jgi:hypothetical protein
MPRSVLTHLAVVLLVVACSNTNEPDHTGSMSFDYHGSLPDAPHGTFDVVGSRKFAATDYPTGAGGFTNTDGGTTIIDVAASQHEGPQLFDMLFAGPPVVGALPMCVTLTPPTTMCVESGYWQTGPIGGSLHNFGSQSSFSTPRPVMNVTIISLTDRRIAGTFEGTAVGTCATCASSTAADTVTITNGHFDVPYR